MAGAFLLALGVLTAGCADSGEGDLARLAALETRIARLEERLAAAERRATAGAPAGGEVGGTAAPPSARAGGEPPGSLAEALGREVSPEQREVLAERVRRYREGLSRLRDRYGAEPGSPEFRSAFVRDLARRFREREGAGGPSPASPAATPDAPE